MAGDWIKMRGNLWDDPRVAALCDMTDCAEAQIVGALYWLWAMADQHSEDGFLPNLTLRQIDRKTGTPGFGKALCEIEWLAEADDGVTIAGFEQHNGASAKKRSQTAKRVATHKSGNADSHKEQQAGNAQSTQEQDLGNAPSVTTALAREREREELLKKTGDACKAMREAGLQTVNGGSPLLEKLIRNGVTTEQFAYAAAEAISRGNGFAYALSVAESNFEKSKNPPQPHTPKKRTPQPENFESRDYGVGVTSV